MYLKGRKNISYAVISKNSNNTEMHVFEHPVASIANFLLLFLHNKILGLIYIQIFVKKKKLRRSKHFSFLLDRLYIYNM